ncbi:electron transfer flavoprotein regulatory factor 1 [Chrysoperla carnea]|uniref:electron transfer flavoprotein regulatory factor 1 n=1 Tax=Chrysoperla carnea TaxID=189513 RepID=UPI001D088026|nr:electron transfer flavoprotein regulatory factor 1 [Chrysoperla carnea]
MSFNYTIMSTTRSQVIQLYKTLLHLGKDYPTGFEPFRAKLHNAFMRNKDETDPKKIEKQIALGQYIVKEIEALYMLKKYRTLKRRYYEDQ